MYCFNFVGILNLWLHPVPDDHHRRWVDETQDSSIIPDRAAGCLVFWPEKRALLWKNRVFPVPYSVLINVAENFSQCWVRRTFYCGPPLNIRVGWISKYYTQERRKSLFKRYGAALQRSMDKRQYYCKPSVLSTQGWKNCHYSGKTCQSWNFCQKIFSQTNDDAMPLELDQMVLKIKIFKSLSHRLSTYKSLQLRMMLMLFCCLEGRQESFYHTW